MRLQPIYPNVYNNFSNNTYGVINQAQSLVNPLDIVLASLNINKYDETTEPNLLQQKEYAKLMAIQDCMDGTNHSYYVQKHIQEPAFKELAESKYFNTPKDFKKLTNIVSALEEKKQNAMAQYSSPYYRVCTIPDMVSYYANINITDCINNINKFFKSKFSEDLKLHIKDNTKFLMDLHKTSTNLAYLNPENPDVFTLSDSAYCLL